MSKVIGKLNPNSNQRLVVYDNKNSAPTLQTAMGTGGGQVPMIIEDFYKNRDERVYKETAPTIRSDRTGLKTIVAMRGRNPENPSDRRAGIKLEQRLEPQQEGICNTLTSVHKDNLVLQLPRGFNKGGCKKIMPPITSNSFQENNLVIEQKPISTKGKEIEVASTILEGYHRTNMTGFNADNGVCEIKKVGQISSDGSQYGTVLSEDGLSGTLQAGTYGYANNVICEKVKIKQATDKGYIECKIGGVADLSFPNSTTRRGRVQDGGETSPSLTVAGIDGLHKIESPYRIRKLSPLECFRLMGFTDEEFHKAEAVNSNTQLYKQAGNSIVVDVLQYIFKEIFEPTERKHEGQLSIFDMTDYWKEEKSSEASRH